MSGTIRKSYHHQLLAQLFPGVGEWARARITEISFELMAEDAHSADNRSLHVAYANGHLEVVQWLVQLFVETAEGVRAEDNHA